MLHGKSEFDARRSGPDDDCVRQAGMGLYLGDEGRPFVSEMTKRLYRYASRFQAIWRIDGSNRTNVE